MPFRKIARAFTKMLGTWRGSYGHTGVQTIAPRSKVGRDAVRASEANFEARSLEATRAERGAGRIPVGNNCAKPATNV